ncbi:hypothetical protein SDC9_173075 [bioreactor metagenome]|uniref:Uncharacterized protein n=1 Tax=bioreactor metagenome TaxID=1076179 RepID=A0A645GPQ9_9ZZZZ
MIKLLAVTNIFELFVILFDFRFAGFDFEFLLLGHFTQFFQIEFKFIDARS